MKRLEAYLKKDTAKREDVIAATSVLGIAANLGIAAAKLAVGFATGSLAVISEAVNNATDAVTSVLALVGTRLSKKRPDAKHPFGYGRIEYLTSLVISVLILVSGTELGITSIERIVAPVAPEVSFGTIAFVAVTGVIKFLLGVYTIRTGKRVDAGALIAIGKECRNDSFASLVTILSALVFLTLRWNLDAFAGLFTAGIILKAGIEVLLDTIGDLLGRPGKKELADALYREIRAQKGVLNAADMMLHSYGPEHYSGSVNLELDQSLTVGESYAFLHRLQLRLMHEYHVTMVFGIYAVDRDSEDSRALRQAIAAFVREREHILSYHAVYLDAAAHRLYCDFVVDYAFREEDAVREAFARQMQTLYPDYTLELTVETEYV